MTKLEAKAACRKQAPRGLGSRWAAACLPCPYHWLGAWPMPCLLNDEHGRHPRSQNYQGPTLWNVYERAMRGSKSE